MRRGSGSKTIVNNQKGTMRIDQAVIGLMAMGIAFGGRILPLVIEKQEMIDRALDRMKDHSA